MSQKDEKSVFTDIAEFFVTRSRVSLLLFIAIIGLGALSYTTFLKREGFPSVEVPIAVIQTPYFVGDSQLVDENVTEPVLKAISDVKGYSSISSTTLDNFSIIVVEFEETVSSEEGGKRIKDELRSETAISPDVLNSIEVQTFKADQFLGKYDLIFNISADNLSSEELQAKAVEIAEAIKKNENISNAEAIEVITQEVNPITGEAFLNTSGFNRNIIRVDGKLTSERAITIGVIQKNENVSTIELSESVHEEIDKLTEKAEMDDINVTFVGDFAISLEEQFSSLQINARDGLIAVIVIAFLFINFRAAVTTALFIPTIMCATFLALYLSGNSLNIITLFALVLILGLFVDDATVVIEAIDYHKKRGEKGLQAVKNAIYEVAIPDTTGTLTVILVFLPMVFISGILGDFIIGIPVTVIMAMSLSLLISLTIVPYLANVLINDKPEEKEKQTLLGKIIEFPSILVDAMAVSLSRFVNFYLKYPLIAIFVIIPLSLALIAFGGSFASKIKFSIFPSPKDTNELIAQLTFPQGTTVEEAEASAINFENIIMAAYANEIENVSYYEADDQNAIASIVLTDMDSRDITSKEIVENLQEKYDKVQDADIKIQQASVGPPTTDYQFFMQIYAEDQTVLENAVKDIQSYINNKEIQDGEKVIEVASENLDNISRIDNRRYAVVKAKLSDPENTGLILELQEQIEAEYTIDRLDNLGLDSDSLGFDLGQESENLESFNSAGVALIAALVIIYALLVIQFNSFTQPLLVLLAIPLTIPGLFPGLYATDNALSFFVMIGIIGLSGIVLNNTIMLVSYTNLEMARGRTVRQAMVNAVRRRFRPILTTTATTLSGLVPLALHDPFWEGLALAMIFGLISSSILVLNFFPAYFYVLQNSRNVRNQVLKDLGKTWKGIKGLSLDDVEDGLLDAGRTVRDALKVIFRPFWT